MLSTSGEFVEVLNFREDNEESSEETTGCKASVYAEFNECTRWGCEITVSTEKEDFSFKMNERSSFMLKLTCDENFNYKL